MANRLKNNLGLMGWLGMTLARSGNEAEARALCDEAAKVVAGIAAAG